MMTSNQSAALFAESRLCVETESKAVARVLAADRQ
jgi:hypothetical protein